MSTSFVLKGIENIVKGDVKFFSMIRQNGEKKYICMGISAMFLVDFDPPEKRVYYYAWIKDVVMDKSNMLLFEITFYEDRPTLVMESFQRDQVLDELHICWKTDHMLRLWKYGEFPIKRGIVLQKKKKRTAEEFTNAPDGMVKHSHKKYFWFMPEKYQRDHVPGLQDARFKGEGEDSLQVRVVKPSKENSYLQVASLGKREKDNLRLAAEKMGREVAMADNESAILRSEQYHKKMNLAGDLASWTCWAVHLRTNVRDIGVLAVRRKFIPPVGDTYQDIYILYIGEQDTIIANPMEFMVPMQDMVDSICPEVRVLFYDDTITKIKADGLLYTEEEYSWFMSQNIISDSIDCARAFHKSLVNILVEEGMTGFHLEEIEPSTRIVDPYTIINTLHAEAPGLKMGISDNKAWANWRRRCSRFFSWVADGGLHPGEFDIPTLVTMHRKQGCSMANRDTLERLFDYFLHLCAKGQAFEAEVGMGDKVNDDKLMANCTLNESVCVTLLKSGYLQRMLDEEVPPKFTMLLIKLLKRPHTRQELLVEVCNQIALVSIKEHKRAEIVQARAVVPLIELLRSDDEVLLLSVAKALVNLSAQNERAKESIVNEGGIRALIQHLGNKTNELTRAFCILMKNCLTDEKLRDRIRNDGAVLPLVTLLKDSNIQGAVRNEEVMSAAASALWNLAANDQAKQSIASAGALQIMLNRMKIIKDVELLHKLAGAIMVVCANNDKNKRELGQLGGIQTIVVTLRNAEDKNVIRACMGALAVASSVDDNLLAMKAEGIEAQLDRMSKMKDKQVKEFGSQLNKRIFKKE